jgi:hypothetical protein
MIATDIEISGKVTCGKAKSTIRAFFLKKMSDTGERRVRRRRRPAVQGLPRALVHVPGLGGPPECTGLRRRPG